MSDVAVVDLPLPPQTQTHPAACVPPLLTPQPAAPTRNIVLAFPCYGDANIGAVRGVFSHPGRKCRVAPVPVSVSLLGQTFNIAWTTMLNALEAGENVTHFAMLHADVEPDNCWLDTLIDELEAQNADVLSVVIPIKDGRGVTSTAIARPGDSWNPLFRLTMRQVGALPVTFGAADCGHPDKALLVNTGCWVMRVSRDWSFDFPAFSIMDRTIRLPVKNDAGEVVRYHWKAEVEPEDWRMSRWLHATGRRVLATRKVRVLHHGKASFPNYECDANSWPADQDLDRAESEVLSRRLGILPTLTDSPADGVGV